MMCNALRDLEFSLFDFGFHVGDTPLKLPDGIQVDLNCVAAKALRTRTPNEPFHFKGQIN